MYNPNDAVSLVGYGILRGVTLALPSERVCQMLPYGLTLGEQSITPAGTHPVIVLFNEIVRARMSIPTLLPNLTYHEQSLGIPCTYLTGTARICAGWSAPGPFYYQPRLHLDDFLATLGGWLYWGFPKLLARFRVTHGAFEVSSQRGEPITALELRAAGSARALADMPLFAAVRRLHDQPLISMLPLAAGPFFVCSSFDKDWRQGTIRPLHTLTHVTSAYVPGLTPGSFEATGIDRSALGSYELRLPWRLSLPYPPYAAPYLARPDCVSSKERAAW